MIGRVILCLTTIASILLLASCAPPIATPTATESPASAGFHHCLKAPFPVLEEDWRLQPVPITAYPSGSRPIRKVSLWDRDPVRIGKGSNRTARRTYVGAGLVPAQIREATRASPTLGITRWLQHT